MKKVTTALITLAALAGLTASARASGSIDSIAEPTASASAMYSLEDIYLRLLSGVPGTKRGIGFNEPLGTAWTTTGHTLNEIMALMPVADATHFAADGDVTAGQVYWALGGNTYWGQRTGTFPIGANVTGYNGYLEITIPDGRYVGNKTATAVDSNLVAGNIKSGVYIFGHRGTAPVPYGTAVAADVRASKTFTSTGSVQEISGTMVERGAETVITPGTASTPIPVGYHNGSSSTVAGDANLVGTNIRAGSTIFGVAGSYSNGATATASDIVAGKTAYVNGSLVSGTKPLRTVLVNETGATTCGSASSNAATCPVATGTNVAYSHQDAEYRRGGMLFSTDSTCIRDNITGLTWENKPNDNGLHDKDWKYTWYNSNAATNGGNAGTVGTSGCGTDLTTCNTEAYVNAVNAASWCAYNDWRLPTVSELRSIVEYNGASPAIYINTFVNTYADNYWTSTTVSTDTSKAWTLAYTILGLSSNSVSKSTAKYIRLVRGGL